MEPVSICSVLAGIELMGAVQVSPVKMELDFFWHGELSTLYLYVGDYEICFPEVELPELPESE